eukprot:SAG31_NODE_1601_length_7786_cov_33.553272_10_plen_90_part_00
MQAGDQELIEKFSKRTVRADKSHTEVRTASESNLGQPTELWFRIFPVSLFDPFGAAQDCIKLLELMGVPVVKAVSEAGKGLLSRFCANN